MPMKLSKLPAKVQDHTTYKRKQGLEPESRGLLSASGLQLPDLF